MKYCMIVTGGGEIGNGINRMAANLHLTEAEHEPGFHLYRGENANSPDIAVFDIEELGTRDCADIIRDLGRDHHLTLFCATAKDQIRMKNIFGAKLAIRPFDLGAICAQATPAATIGRGMETV